MANDLDLYDGGDIQPYDPGMPVLAPLSPTPDTWGNTQLTPREIDQSQRSGGLQLFGEPMPPGTTPQQVQATLGEVAGVYLSDFSKLGHPNKLIQSAIQFFMDNATKPPRQVRRNHSFNLHDQAGDWLAESFGNFLHSLSGTQASKQKFLSDSLWWLGELHKKIGSSGPDPSPGMALSSANPLDQLSDAQYAQVVKANDAARAATMGYLQNLWGDSFDANLRMVNNYYASLPLKEQQALDQITTGYISSLNTREIILGLYKQAIGSNSLPSGGAVATEIAEHERVMKYDRKRWISDERLQARYRELITLRDGR